MLLKVLTSKCGGTDENGKGPSRVVLLMDCCKHLASPNSAANYCVAINFVSITCEQNMRQPANLDLCFVCGSTIVQQTRMLSTYTQPAGPVKLYTLVYT